MGWMFTHKAKGVSVREFFQEEFGEGYQILACSVKDLSVAYMACKSVKTGVVFGVVCLLRYVPKDYNYNFGYKDMDESMGPCESYCPEHILKMLSPTEHQYAKQWRERCWKNVELAKARKKIKKGDVIVFKDPVQFRNGSVRSELRVLDLRRRMFTDVDSDYERYRVSNWMRREYEVKK